MNAVEKLAIALNRRAWRLAISSFLLLFGGLLVVDAGADGVRHWGFVGVALGILLGGFAIFSELFAPKEQALKEGQYVRVSKVTHAGALPTFVAFTFFGAWFAGWCVIAALLVLKMAGVR